MCPGRRRGVYGRVAVDFGSWLAARLAEREWTMRRLANALGVSEPSVTKWLKGKNIPEPKRIPAIARLFGVPESEVRQFYPWLDQEEQCAAWWETRLREIIPIDADFVQTI